MSQAKANGMLAIVTIFWGASYLFMKMGLSSLPPFYFIALRFLLAFFIAGAVFYQRLWRVDRRTIRHAFLLGTLLFLVFAFVMIGVQSTTTSHAGFLVSLTVIFVPLFSALFLKQKLARQVVIGVCLAMIGIALLTIKGGFVVKQGDVLCILAAVCYAMHIVVTGQLTKHSDSIALGILQLGACGFISLVVSLSFESPTSPTPSAWIAIFALGILCSAIGFVVQTVAQKYTTAAHAGLIFSLEPVFAALFGYLFLGEVLPLKGYIGAALVLIGILYAELPRKEFPLKEKREFSRQSG
ncbi:DMT family transporter [Anoxybacillus sp. J5B_2022]|uniref:DMT family transporter n=1 Tax=Anoxybacillus sp. J5B_2022 TaxID=3003246 RepID=UPI0022865BB1|nr:DMT family transporter [Anoxybacillus sp. J5B_2022]MCZ0755913.1 DMT family transporter [Anoxybacillus sp. J5B_2022]